MRLACNGTECAVTGEDVLLLASCLVISGHLRLQSCSLQAIVMCHAQVALSALRLTNAAAAEQSTLHALALQGLIPAVGAFRDRSQLWESRANSLVVQMSGVCSCSCNRTLPFKCVPPASS